MSLRGLLPGLAVTIVGISLFLEGAGVFDMTIGYAAALVLAAAGVALLISGLAEDVGAQMDGESDAV